MLLPPLLFSVGYFGHYGVDDMEYARLAHAILAGEWEWTNHYLYRWTLLLPVALAYHVLGVNDLASALPAMLAYAILTYASFLALRHLRTTRFALGLSLASLSPWLLFYADKLMPDIWVAASSTLALVILYLYRYQMGANPIRGGIYLSLAILMGFLAKGTIILIAPLIVLLCVLDLVAQRFWRFWLTVLLSAILLLGGYFLLIHHLTGHALARFVAIAQNSYLNSCSYDQQDTSVLWARISTGFWEMGVRESILVAPLLGLALLPWRKFSRWWQLHEAQAFWSVSLVVLLLSANFMSISVTSYNPMCLDPRHYLYLIPVGGLAAGFNFRVRAPNWGLWGLLSLMTIYTGLYYPEQCIYCWLPLWVVFTTYRFFFKGKRWGQYVFIFGLIFSLLLLPGRQLQYARRVDFRGQLTFIRQHLDALPDYDALITDHVQQRLLPYYRAFAPDSVPILHYEEIALDSLSGSKILMLDNPHTRFLAGKQDDNLPWLARFVKSYGRQLAADTTLGMALYELSLAEIDLEPLASFQCDFESPDPPYWQVDSRHQSTEAPYAGRYAQQIGEYSATLRLPLDTLSLNPGTHLKLRMSAYCRFAAATQAQLVVELRQGPQTTHWQSRALQPQLHVAGHWWPVSYEVLLPAAQLAEARLLQVYIWNPGRQDGFLDNFSVDLSALRIKQAAAN
ncbi:MAG: hypothetical protein D6772_15125 [Bacteroidetes bacterium]|nr:MAG: hypothetical protein D6772_15125 [Bacteroidota bacterium]